MHIAGVIAEYNPFHCGHAYHLCQINQFGADAVVAVMSGNFVQRGTPAILSKFARAKAAAQCGADLVIELPVPWAIGRAQTFADGAVSILRSLGCVETLAFGSECGDADSLCQTATSLQNREVDEQIRTILSSGNITYASARQKAVEDLFGRQTADILRNPNDTLAVEYILSAKRSESQFRFLAVPRVGQHDAMNSDAGFPSASQIRAHLHSGNSIFGCPNAMKVIWEEQVRLGVAPASLRRMERAILADWRVADPAELANLPDVSEGLERRLIDAARHADSLTSFYETAKTKRYTLARIRRIVLARVLGIYASDIPASVPYIRVLAVGEKGREVLHIAKQTCKVPILTRSADRHKLDPAADRLLQTEFRAGEYYALLLPKPGVAGAEPKTPIYFVEEQR